MKKQERGITLIALIITVIVLLILAVVSISVVQDSGIITYAKKSTKDYIYSQLKEKIDLEIISRKMAESYNVTNDTRERMYKIYENAYKFTKDEEYALETTMAYLDFNTFESNGTMYVDIVSEELQLMVIASAPEEFLEEDELFCMDKEYNMYKIQLIDDNTLNLSGNNKNLENVVYEIKSNTIINEKYEYCVAIDNNKVVNIVSYLGSEEVVNVGEDFEGYTVLSLGNNAFFPKEGENYISNTTTKQVILPDSINWLGSYCFASCSALQEINIPKNLTVIPPACFNNSGLTSINLPDNITTIGSGAFYECESLVNVTLSKNLETVGTTAFQYCDNLTTVNMPSVKNIYRQAFAFCNKLRSIHIPSNITYIDSMAFTETSCEITIDKNETDLGGKAPWESYAKIVHWKDKTVTYP